MSTIWKFKLEPGSPTTVLMPDNARILTVQQQGPDPEAVFLWAFVDPSEPTVERQFETYGTGHPISDPPVGCGRDYIGTFQLHGGALAFHVFELVAR